MEFSSVKNSYFVIKANFVIKTLIVFRYRLCNNNFKMYEQCSLDDTR